MAIKVSERQAFIAGYLLPIVTEWGFTEADLNAAITLIRIPKSFPFWTARKNISVCPDARHREKIRDRGENLERVASLDMRPSFWVSSHIYIFVTPINRVPALRGDWHRLPEPERKHPAQKEPEIPNIDPGHGGHTADVGARRLQRFLDR